jgi:oxygen-independent coproporphyrinogen-3 oxidase
MSLPVTAELLLKYDRPGPRYTSYPTAIEFDESFTAARYREKLALVNAAADEPLSLYVHIPFCEERCSFCGCHVIITRQRQRADEYLDRLLGEIDLLAAAIPDRRRLVQYHWGGGTPTYLGVEQMRRLHAKVFEHFAIEPDAEMAIEVDPRVTTNAQVDALVEMGMNRFSMGVQDFTPEVQAIIDRNQTEAETRRLYDHCRARGVGSINLDLIYGLPRQSANTFRANLDTVIAMRPDRVACYSYAYVPWIKGNQKKIDPDELPSAEQKIELFGLAIDAFIAAGYRQIGMDHFALPDDELSLAVESGTLHRNFMGYTVKPASDFIGVGISAIGDVRGAYAQNEKKLSTYYAAVDAGEFPVLRGVELSRDDLIRRDVITQLMCNFRLAKSVVAERWSIDFDGYFAAELRELAEDPGSLGFVELDDTAIVVPARGRLFIRNICMIFDAYLKSRQGDGPTFSRTV